MSKTSSPGVRRIGLIVFLERCKCSRRSVNERDKRQLASIKKGQSLYLEIGSQFSTFNVISLHPVLIMYPETFDGFAIHSAAEWDRPKRFTVSLTKIVVIYATNCTNIVVHSSSQSLLANTISTSRLLLAVFVALTFTPRREAGETPIGH